MYRASKSCECLRARESGRVLVFFVGLRGLRGFGV